MATEYVAEVNKLVRFSHALTMPAKSMRDILDQGVKFLREELMYDSAEFYCLYRYAGTMGRAASSDDRLPVRDMDYLQSVMFEGRVVADSAGSILVPIMAHGGTEPIVPGEERAEGLRHWGIMVVTSAATPDEHALSLLDLLGQQIAQACEIFELRQYEKNILGCLGQTQEISMNGRAANNVSELFAIMREAPSIQAMFDGLGIWLHSDGDGFCSGEAYLTENIRGFDIGSLSGDGMFSDPKELYGVDGVCHSAILCPLINATRFYGVIGFFKDFKRMFRSEERAAAQVISRQAAYSVESILLRRDLETQDIALKFEKDFSEKIFDSINSGIIVIDVEGIVLTANPHALNDLDLMLQEVVGMEFETLIPGLLDAACSSQREGFFELCSGKGMYLGFNVSPLTLSDGVAGKIILFRDISEIMNLRKELRRKEYFSTIGRMASWIAHEVRNPVFAISSIATILHKQAKDNEQEMFVSSILKETKTLNMLVDDLLLYGKPLELKREKISIGEFLADTAQGMESLATALGGRVSVGVVDGSSCSVKIDKDRMKEVFYNVIKNSLEAGADMVVIDVTVEEGNLQLRLRDNGKGIKSSHIAEMFTPFFTTKKGGSGLGLPICRKIVEEHGGTIRISSRPGMGAEVHIVLDVI